MVKWFSLSNNRQLYLIGGAAVQSSISVFQHPCFSIDAIEPFIEKLKAAGITYYDAPGKPRVVQVRGDGVTQLFIKDPDGNWIEINNRKH